MRHLILLSALALAACGSATPGSASGSGPASTRPDFAVAGLKIGMSAQQVADVLTRAGYCKRSERPGWTFQEETARARGQGDPRMTGVGEQDFAKGGETVAVTYAAMPAGPVAQEIVYSVPVGVMASPDVIAELTRRYGARSYEAKMMTGRQVTWCESGTAFCEKTQPHLFVSPSGQFTSITLADPTVWERQRQAIRNESGGQKPTF